MSPSPLGVFCEGCRKAGGGRPKKNRRVFFFGGRASSPFAAGTPRISGLISAVLTPASCLPGEPRVSWSGIGSGALFLFFFARARALERAAAAAEEKKKLEGPEEETLVLFLRARAGSQD